MRRAAVLSLLIAVAAPVAATASLPTLVEALTDAINARIIAIENMADITVEDLKERAALVKARNGFYSWEGTADTKDLGVVAKALSVTFKATADGVVAASAGTLREYLVTLADGDLATAQTARDALADPAHRAKVTAAIDKAMASVDRGATEPDWGKGAKLVLKGRTALAKAQALAGKYLQQEAAKRVAAGTPAAIMTRRA